MTTPNEDTLLARVRKLLAKAEDPACTPEEAAALNDKAAELIAKYGIDQAMLAASDPTRDKVGDRVLSVQMPYAAEKVRLLAAIAAELRCRVVQRKEFNTRTQYFEYTAHLFGFGADLERVELLYTSLLVQSSIGLASARVPLGEHQAAFRRSWLFGFRQAVARRLHAAESYAAQQQTQTATGASGPSVALVLADRTAIVNRTVDDAYPKLGTAPRQQLSGSGHRAGYDAGQRADLGTTRLGQQRREALAR